MLLNDKIKYKLLKWIIYKIKAFYRLFVYVYNDCNDNEKSIDCESLLKIDEIHILRREHQSRSILQVEFGNRYQLDREP